MAEHTSIAWTHHTFNPWLGCTKVSEGCRNCYAEKHARRFHWDHFGKGKPRREFGSKYWLKPLRWDTRAKQSRIRERVFCGSMCDVFDPEASPENFANLMKLIDRTPALDWLLLTKRIERAKREAWACRPNMWLGVTVENRDAMARIRTLAELPAIVRFLSCEPLLEDLGELDLRGIHWVIAGAESGPGARPMNEDWVRSLRDQCIRSGVAFFYKQRIENRKKVTLPLLDGRQWAEFPKGGAA